MSLKPKTRLYIYRIIGAVVPLLVTLGLISGEISAQILNIASAVLTVAGTALASANVPSDN